MQVPGGEHSPWEGLQLFREYLHWLRKYPVHVKMVRGHMHQALGPWLAGEPCGCWSVLEVLAPLCMYESTMLCTMQPST